MRRDGFDVAVSQDKRDEKLAAVRERCDIVQIVGRHVSLKKSGRNHVGLCPFHNESTPSFSVSADKKLYHCFGCHVGGDVFDFIMRFAGLDFSAALRQLAEQVGVELEAEPPHVRQERALRQTLANINRAAQAYFEQLLWSPRGQAAQQYLQGRGIPAKLAKERHLGFGGPADALLQHLAKQGFDVESIRRAGLLPEHGERPLFTARLTFPILDLEGRVAGFGGRRLNDDKTQPKYVNSRDGALFQKRGLLYGLHEGQGCLRHTKRVIVVEGYTDVLAMAQAGLGETVAALGTAFNPEHAGLCKRFVREAVVLMDADTAGQKAAQEASQVLLKAGLKTSVAAIPGGEDPDSVLRAGGPAALQRAVAATRPAVEYFMEKAFAGSLSIEDKADAARGLQPLLSCLESGLERDLYTHRLAEKVGVSVEQLRRHLRPPRAARASAGAGPSRAAAPRESDPPPPSDMDGPPPTEMEGPPQGLMSESGRQASAPRQPAPSSSPNGWELDLLRELLLFPQLRARFGELAEYAVSSQMAALLDALAEDSAATNEILSVHVHDQRWLQRLARVQAVPADELDAVNAKSNRTFDDVLAALKRRHLDAALQQVMRELSELEARGEATDMLLRRKRELTARKRALRRVSQ